MSDRPIVPQDPIGPEVAVVPSTSSSPSLAPSAIVPLKDPYGGLPNEVWSWIFSIANSKSNGGEPHPERYEALYDYIDFIDTFHGNQHSSPELLACCLASRRFYGLASRLIYRDVTLFTLEKFEGYVRMIQQDATSSDPRRLGQFLISLDIKDLSSAHDIFALGPPTEPNPSSSTLPLSSPSAPTLADLLLHTPNVTVLLVGDEANVRPALFKVVEARAPVINLACWYGIEVTNNNLVAFLAAMDALSGKLQEIGFHSTSSALVPPPSASLTGSSPAMVDLDTFPSITLPHAHSLRIRSPMTGGNGSLFRLLTAWDLPSLRLLHVDPHDEEPSKASFLIPFLSKHGPRIVDFFWDSTLFEDFLPLAHLVPNLTSISCYLFDLPIGVSLDPLKPILANLESLLAHSAKEYSGFEPEELVGLVEEEIARATRVTAEVDRKAMPSLERMLWVGGKSADRGGDIIQAWFDRLKDQGVDAKLVIADAAPVSVFADEADEDTSGDFGS